MNVLSREQCLRLMATASVGRVIYTRQAMPAVELVDFIVTAGDIAIRTSASGSLIAAIRGTVIAFEADSYDPASSTGWYVTAIGHAREVCGPTDPPYSVRITPGTLNGRYLRALVTERPSVNPAGNDLLASAGEAPPPGR